MMRKEEDNMRRFRFSEVIIFIELTLFPVSSVALCGGWSSSMKKKDSKTKHCIRAYVFILATSMLWVTIATPCYAEETVFRDLARKMQNPVSDRISFSFEDKINFGVGLNNDVQNILNIKSLYSFNLGDNWNLINRTIVPVVDQPELVPGSGDQFGLGDISSTFFLMPRSSRFAIFGIGPTVSFPTATDEALGTRKWGVGPAAVAVIMPGRWVIGALVANLWSVGGDSNRKDINSMTIQPFVFYNFPNGWYIVSSPIIRAVWTSDSDDRWIVPLGGGVGNIFEIGKQKMNASVQAFYNVEKPEAVADWSLRLQLQFLFPK